MMSSRCLMRWDIVATSTAQASWVQASMAGISVTGRVQSSSARGSSCALLFHGTSRVPGFYSSDVLVDSLYDVSALVVLLLLFSYSKYITLDVSTCPVPSALASVTLSCAARSPESTTRRLFAVPGRCKWSKSDSDVSLRTDIKPCIHCAAQVA